MEGAQSLFAKNITKKFHQGTKDFEVLRGITQEFKRGDSYAVVGVSGSGKSTFMHIIGGLDRPSSGDVALLGHSLYKNSQRSDLLNRYIGFVFQFHYLVKELSVLENVMLPGLIAGMPRYDAASRAMELLDFLGMTFKAHSYPTALSGGEQQRVSIVRAMFNKPAFLIADEPTGNLDEGNADQAVKLLLEGCNAWNMALIVCSHDRHVYEQMGTVLRMHQGILAQEK
jgi:lipoprotein-releasing system ATP-binding protein